MLGKAFFDWIARVAAAGNYGEVLATHLDGSFKSLVEADSVAVTEWSRDGKLLARHGDNERSSRESLEGVVAQCVAGTIKVEISSDRGFAPAAADHFRVATLLVEAHLRRIFGELYDKRVRERLFLARREAESAAFIISHRKVVPFNPAAVAYSDAYWDADELEYQLGETQAEEFWGKVTASWKNPVDPQWTSVSVDLGGGLTEVQTIARHNGDAVVLFTPPPRDPPVFDIPMLTRRQRDIMEWIAEGKTSAETAIILDISPRTVEKHLEAVFQRFGVENRVAAVRTYLDLKAGIDPRIPAI
jgi:DNA-binding CsgD family transcriptional regulator